MAKRPAKDPAPDFTGAEPIVVLHGKEPFLQTEHTRRLREAVEGRSSEPVETLRHEGKTAQLADVLDDLRSVGLMQQHKIVIVADADPFITAHREALERYAESPEPTATLVLRPGTWNASWKLHKAIRKVGVVVKCESPNEADAARWLTRRAAEHHRVKLEPRIAGRLVERLGADLGRLDSELGKLAAGLSEGEAITAERIETLVGHASEEKAWEIQEALLSGNPARAIAKLHELIDLAGQPDVLVTYFVADLMRKLHHAAVMLGERQNEFTVCKALRIWPKERQTPFIRAAKRLGTDGAARLLDGLVELDRRSKSGFGKTTPNLERFCIQFTKAL